VSKKRKAEVLVDTPKSTPGSKQVWKLMDRGSTVAAGVVAKQASELTWKLATGKTPPTNQKNPDSNLREVAAWAFVGAGLTELVRVLIKRGTASYWVKSTGHLPPGMKPLKQPDQNV
jgi:hypothetical protein